MEQVFGGGLPFHTIRYEKSFVSAPLQIHIHYESAVYLADKNVPDRNTTSSD